MKMASFTQPAFAAPAVLSSFNGIVGALTSRHMVPRPCRRRPRAVVDNGGPDSSPSAASEEIVVATASAAKSAPARATQATACLSGHDDEVDGLVEDILKEDDSNREDGGTVDGLVTIGPVFGKTVRVPGRYLLYAVPFFWGTFGPAVRLLFMSDPHPGPSFFNTERLLLSNLVYLPVLTAEIANVQEKMRLKKQSEAREAGGQNVDEEQVADPFLSMRAGVELGAYVFCANVAQVIGLQSTSAGRAAFLVQLQTVFIPIIAAALGIAKVSRNTWIGAFTALAGVALLSSDKGHGGVSSLSGDALEVLSAFFFSLFVIRLGAFCNRIPSGPLVASKLVVQAFLSICWALCVEAMELSGPAGSYDAAHMNDHPWTLAAIGTNVAVVAWTGLVSSALSGWCQSKGQQTVDADETAVIFATQPLWAAATAALVLGEAFGPKGFAGGGLILAATIFSSLPEKSESDDKKGAVAGVKSE